MTENIKKKPCIGCQTLIPEKAKICPECSTRQDARFNNLQIIGTVIGVITAILAFASYIITTVPAVRQTLFWKDNINILSYSDEFVTIGNNGDGDVFMSYIFIQVESTIMRRTTTRIINQTIESGKIINVDLKYLDRHQNFAVLSGKTDEEWNNYLMQAEGISLKGGQCIFMTYASKDSPELEMYIDFLGDNLRMVDAQATIYYYSVKEGSKLSKDFPVYGILMKSEENCSK